MLDGFSFFGSKKATLLNNNSYTPRVGRDLPDYLPGEKKPKKKKEKKDRGAARIRTGATSDYTDKAPQRGVLTNWTTAPTC